MALALIPSVDEAIEKICSTNKKRSAGDTPDPLAFSIPGNMLRINHGSAEKHP